ncbi:hypothetical protein [Bordetella petrii]|uniref:hypothetical protein n=1 Tax=Bordetella petrii TaxID=94624 RepID=UPI001F602FB4|nr:hypothetical protein [Bordetella petrii]
MIFDIIYRPWHFCNPRDKRRNEAGPAQRVAYTLEQCGYLKKDARIKRYRVTVKAVGLGYSYISAPTSRWLLERARQDLGPLVIRTARAISKNTA